MPDTYIDEIVACRRNVTVYVLNGFRMSGVVVHNSCDYIVLLSDGVKKMVYKHAISTIEPVEKA